MEKLFQRIKNWNVSVREVNGRVVFLRKLQRGGSAHSFGIHVARLAGMPQSIVKRAEQILSDLEKAGAQAGSSVPRAESNTQLQEGMQLSFFQLWAIRRTIRQLYDSAQGNRENRHQKIARLRDKAAEMDFQIRDQLLGEARVSWRRDWHRGP